MPDDTLPEAFALLIEQIQSITKAMNDDDQLNAMIETDILIKSLDERFVKDNKINLLADKIDHYLTDPNTNRYLRLNQRIKSEMETAIEYYDKDIGNDERLFYQEDMEKALLIVNKEIRGFLALIIKNKLKDEITFD